MIVKLKGILTEKAGVRKLGLLRPNRPNVIKCPHCKHGYFYVQDLHKKRLRCGYCHAVRRQPSPLPPSSAATAVESEEAR